MRSRSRALKRRVSNDRANDGFSPYLAVLANVGAASAITMTAKKVTRRINPPSASGSRRNEEGALG